MLHLNWSFKTRQLLTKFASKFLSTLRNKQMFSSLCESLSDEESQVHCKGKDSSSQAHARSSLSTAVDISWGLSSVHTPGKFPSLIKLIAFCLFALSWFCITLPSHTKVFLTKDMRASISVQTLNGRLLQTSDNRMGRLWKNEPQDADGHSSNTARRFEPVHNSHWLVQTVQPVFHDIVALKIAPPFNAVQLNAKFHLKARQTYWLISNDINVEIKQNYRKQRARKWNNLPGSRKHHTFVYM